MNNDPHAAGIVLQKGPALSEARAAVILLHGRGASAEDIMHLGSAMDLNDVAFLAPQAAGHAWYPLSFLAPREANEPFLSSALAKVGSVVRTIQHAGLSNERIVIAGFSQGACLSTEFVVKHPARYGGLIALTGGLIGAPGTIDASPGGDLAGTPALLLSGDPDPHVPWARVEESAAVLTGMGASVFTKRYPGRPHTVSQDELDLARNLLLGIGRPGSDSSAR